jgi:hypothetical protein
MADASKPRPADDRIPAAVRDAFSTNRLQAAWRMAQGSTQEMRMPAVEAIFRILEKEGLTFEDVMTAVLTIKPSTAGFGVSMEQAFSGFEGIFGDRPFGRNAKPAPEPEAAPARGGTMRRHRSGSDIPATIKGTISIDDERPTRNGRMVVFTVTDGDDVYGPIVCFTSTGIGTLKACAEDDDFAAMSVRQPNGEGMNPSATNVRRL